jgi:hypothetical protein
MRRRWRRTGPPLDEPAAGARLPQAPCPSHERRQVHRTAHGHHPAHRTCAVLACFVALGIAGPSSGSGRAGVVATTSFGRLKRDWPPLTRGRTASATARRAVGPRPPPASGGPVDPGQQFRLRNPAATAVMAHALEDVAQCPIAPRRVALVDHAALAAAVALEPKSANARITGIHRASLCHLAQASHASKPSRLIG